VRTPRVTTRARARPLRRGRAIDRRRTGCSLSRESRLARDFGTTRFGSAGYAIEELVAELGAAFLCADLDLTLEPCEDHAAYIANWLDVLKADNRTIFTAASHAQRAANFIKACSPRPPPASYRPWRPEHPELTVIRPIDILYVVRTFSYRTSVGGWHYAKN
jgi:Zincin-like metallopeptidase